MDDIVTAIAKTGITAKEVGNALMASDHGQPIADWARAQKALNADDREAVAALVGVRTLGDLLAVLERGDVEKELATKLRKVLSER